MKVATHRNAPEQKLTYSVKETVTLTGVSRAKLYQEIRAGRLQIVKLGKRTLVRADALNDYISNLPSARAV